MYILKYFIALTLLTFLPLHADDWMRGKLTRVVGEPITKKTSDLMAHRTRQQYEHAEKDRRSSERPKTLHPEAKDKKATAPTKRSILHSRKNKFLISDLNFTTVTYADTHAFPADPVGAVGPTQFIACTNQKIRSFSKATGIADAVLDISTDDFFASVRDELSTADPRIRFDRLSGRWFIVMINFAESYLTANRVMIAVSSQGAIDADTKWSFFSFYPHRMLPVRPFTEVVSDFPTLGIDANALYIGLNIFDMNRQFVNSDGFVIKKAPLLNPSSPAIEVTAFRNLIDPNTHEGPFTAQGVDVLDRDAKEGYFIGVDASSLGRLMLRRVQHARGFPSISKNIPIHVLSTAHPLKVPHRGNTNGKRGYLDALDDRLCNAHVRDGILYTSHNIGVDHKGVGSSHTIVTRNGCRWYAIDVAAATLVQAGTLFAPSVVNDFDQRHFWIPSLMSNGLHSFVLSCSTAGTLQYADAVYTVHKYNDPPGTLQSPTFYTSSTTAYNIPQDPGGAEGRLWGKISQVSIDPSDNMTLWTAQEYCNAANSYGVQVTRILADPPAQIISCSPSMVQQGISSATLLITGKSSDGTAFYDPGSDFASRLQIQIPGVVVNSVLWIDSTHVQAVISTVGAIPGTKNIILTNPDGQSTTGTGALTVTF